jgi:hypothetical protein
MERISFLVKIVMTLQRDMTVSVYSPVLREMNNDWEKMKRCILQVASDLVIYKILFFYY